VRKRSGRKSRSNMLLDLRKLYVAGVTTDLFKAIDTPTPTEADFEIAFCEDILKTDPAHFEAMSLLGDAYTRKGEFQKGLELDLRLSRLCPDNKLVRYNLACSYALTGQKDKAMTCLNKAVELGYRDVEHLRQDHDLDALKTDPRFQTLIKKLSAEQHEPTSQQG
jgi:tetratricopeptide (TPR) repeat protein